MSKHRAEALKEGEGWMATVSAGGFEILHLRSRVLDRGISSFSLPIATHKGALK